MDMYAHVCARMPMYAFTGLGYAYAYVSLRMHALGFPWPLFFKNSFI